MSTLEALPRLRSVDPTTHRGLDEFCSGTTYAYERDVNKIVSQLHRGAGPGVAVRVAEDAGTGELVGICGFGPRPMIPAWPEPAFDDAVYLWVIGINVAYRGLRLPDGDKRVGEHLLLDALEQIDARWGSEQMPQVWAILARENRACERLLAKHGFKLVHAEGHHDLYVRPRGLPPDWRE